MADNEQQENPPAEVDVAEPDAPQQTAPEAAGEAEVQSQDDLADAWASMIEEPEMEQLQEEKATMPDAALDGMPLDFLLDIPLGITVEVGRTKMQINDLLQLGQGSIIELNKLVGQPFEILVNDKLIARGDVVVVNEKYGIRLTDIVSPMERVESLGG